MNNNLDSEVKLLEYCSVNSFNELLASSAWEGQLQQLSSQLPHAAWEMPGSDRYHN